MEYLKIWTSFAEIIEPLNDAERGRLFTAMLQYAATGEVVEFQGNERYTWPIAKQGIDQAAQKVETLRQNGSKGGRHPKAEESSENQTEANAVEENQTKPNESKTNHTEANESLNVNVNVKDKDKDNDKDNGKGIREKRTRFSPPTIEEVEQYCSERHNGVDAQRFVDFYASKGWKVGQNPMKDWKACVRTWEQRDDQRGNPVQKPKLVRAQMYDQREYNEKEMEDRLGVRDLFKEDAS